jgi:hypothetical protein
MLFRMRPSKDGRDRGGGTHLRGEDLDERTALERRKHAHPRRVAPEPLSRFLGRARRALPRPERRKGVTFSPCLFNRVGLQLRRDAAGETTICSRDAI